MDSACDGDNQRVFKIAGSGTAHKYYVRGLGEVLTEFYDRSGALMWTVDYVYAGSRLVASLEPGTGS